VSEVEKHEVEKCSLCGREFSYDDSPMDYESIRIEGYCVDCLFAINYGVVVPEGEG